MGVWTVGCVICGFPIYESTVSDPKSWLNEFRAVYACPSGAFVTDVGFNDENRGSTWIAPADPDMRWDDEDYDFPATDEIPVMLQEPLDGRHGFILHDACWRLLQKAFQPCKIPLKRLLDVCESLPFPLRGNSVCWGHDYGGLLILDDQDHYPWEDRVTGEYQPTETQVDAEEDPYNVPEIPTILERHLKHLPRWSSRTQHHDCFSRLPWELLEAIAIRLPTNDALSLRHVSRAFLPLLTSATFWVSRFQPWNDRGYMFEKWNCRDATDWLSLYGFAGPTSSSPGLRNRRRIWSLAVPLVDLLSLHLPKRVQMACVTQISKCLHWDEVAGDVKSDAAGGYPIDFNDGCRRYTTHSAQIPENLLAISFSISSVGDLTYIAGIRLITKSGPNICLGYVSGGKQLLCEVATLSGFVIAAGSRGVHALQVVDKVAGLSEWVGCAKNSPITERLAHYDSVDAMQVSFDGFKIVSLGVLAKVAPSVQIANTESSLRTAAMWYPRVPETELCLNEESFTGENPLSSGYQPLFWIHFGGPRGSYLSHITGVSADRKRGRYSLEFHYDANYGPARAFKLGRGKIAGRSEVLEFPIDGFGGERIETIEIALKQDKNENAYSFVKHGTLHSLKMTTNRKRSFHIGALPDNDLSLKALVIAPGTTLTGLYASQHQEFGLISLGVISEITS